MRRALFRERPIPRGAAAALSAGVRVLGAAAVLLAALAVDRGLVGSYEDEPVTVDERPGSRTQAALARVLSVQPPLDEPIDEELPYNPVRGRSGDALHACAATVLTGENRGRVVAFVNRVQDRPDVNVILRPGSLVLLSVMVCDGQVWEVEVLRPPVRWRPLLWCGAILTAVILLALGEVGLRAVLLTLVAGATVLFVTAPLLARGVPPWQTILVSFGLIGAVLLCLWGGGWRAALCAAGGALGGLLAGGATAFAAVGLMGLTGEASASIRMLRAALELHGLDLGQLLAVGITIMAMGAALDIAASVVSGLVEFRRARSDASRRETIQAGIGINRDIAGTMVLTLWFAWLAGRLPALLLMHGGAASGPAWVRCTVIEVVRIVPACVAVMLAGPIAAVLFATVFARRTAKLLSRGLPLSERRRPRTVPVFAALALVVAGLSLWLLCSAAPEAAPSVDPATLGRERSAEVLRSRSRQKWIERDWDTSAVMLWRARELSPGDPRVHRDLAYVYMTRRWPSLAARSIGEALPALDRDAMTHYICGVVAMHQRDAAKAEAHLGRTLELDPGHAGARAALSAILPR